MKSHKRLTLLALAVLGLTNQVVLADDTSHSTTTLPLVQLVAQRVILLTVLQILLLGVLKLILKLRQVQLVQMSKKPNLLFPQKPNPINLYRLAG